MHIYGGVTRGEGEGGGEGGGGNKTKQQLLHNLSPVTGLCANTKIGIVPMKYLCVPSLGFSFLATQRYTQPHNLHLTHPHVSLSFILETPSNKPYNTTILVI